MSADNQCVTWLHTRLPTGRYASQIYSAVISSSNPPTYRIHADKVPDKFFHTSSIYSGLHISELVSFSIVIRWSDGTPTEYVHWGNGQPNNLRGRQDCTEMLRTSGSWNDNGCNARGAYICKYTLGKCFCLPDRVFDRVTLTVRVMFTVVKQYRSMNILFVLPIHMKKVFIVWEIFRLASRVSTLTIRHWRY